MKQLFMKKWVIAALALILIGSTIATIFIDTTQASNPQRHNFIHNVNSNKRLGVGGADKQSAGAHIIQWQLEDVNDQKWYIERLENGYVNIRNAESGLLLDVNGASTADGAKIIQWPDNGGLNQQWSIVPTGTDRGHSSYIINRGSGKYLDMSNYSTSNGGQAIQWSFNGGSNQRWFVNS
ncbi:RICIN domain-containing protein [Paenibacillus yanchengensis]|uniref:RICIN domain-containing protein n=1 Tax=Paenibacillus yanchengensis TaxID=2035833 RepID=A0ABW4YLU2_9BACL